MDIISLKCDYCFKEWFSNETIRRYFISDVLDIPIGDIKSVRMSNTFLWKRYRMQKQGILDVLVILNDNTKINIEMQTTFMSCWDKRSLFYLAKMYTEDLNMIQERNIGIKTAIEEMKRMSLSKRLHMHYDAYLKQKRDAWAIADYQEKKQKKEMEEAVAQARERALEQGLEQGLERGLEQGLEQGLVQGEEKLAKLCKKLLEDNRSADLQKVTEDIEYRKKLYQEYDI